MFYSLIYGTALINLVHYINGRIKTKPINRNNYHLPIDEQLNTSNNRSYQHGVAYHNKFALIV